MGRFFSHKKRQAGHKDGEEQRGDCKTLSGKDPSGASLTCRCPPLPPSAPVSAPPDLSLAGESSRQDA